MFASLMRNTRKITPLLALLIFFSTMTLLGACQKKFGGSSTPAITYKSVSPKVAVEAHDTVLINLSFIDGDGDLGPTSPQDTTANVFVVDKRSGNSHLPFTYRLPNITPAGNNKAIKGDIELRLALPFRRINHPLDTARYTIQIADRAGHRSNVITTDEVIIRP